MWAEAQGWHFVRNSTKCKTEWGSSLGQMDRAVRGTPLRGDSGLIRIKEDQRSCEGADGSKGCVGLSWSLFIDLIYSCKCLESSRALTGSLSFFSAMCHYMGSSSFWSWALCHFPRDAGGLELKKFTSINVSLPDFFSFGSTPLPSCASSEMHLHFNSAIYCPFPAPVFWVLLRVPENFSFCLIPRHPVNLDWIAMSRTGRLWGWHFFAKSYFCT